MWGRPFEAGIFWVRLQRAGDTVPPADDERALAQSRLFARSTKLATSSAWRLGMARMYHWFGCSLLSFAVVGCVSQEKYNALKMDRDQYAERLAAAERQAQSAGAESDAYKRQLDAIMHGASDKDGLLANLTGQIAELQKQNDELNRKYAEAMNRPINAVALPAELNSALNEFARQNPDLVDFDSARGVVKFKSDVTFAAGSADVTPKAREAISRFA